MGLTQRSIDREKKDSDFKKSKTTIPQKDLASKRTFPVGLDLQPTALPKNGSGFKVATHLEVVFFSDADIPNV